MLVGVTYVLAAIVEWYNGVSQWAAQGNTCTATAMIPLSVIGAVLIRQGREG
jgi:hypothetical protein